MRLAITTAHRCRAHLFHREWMARLLTYFDRWLVILGPLSASDPNDDGSAIILQDVARRHAGRVLLEQSAIGWHTALDALRTGCATLRQEIDGEAFLWLVEPGEVWEADALKAAEREMMRKGLDWADFEADSYLSDDILIRHGWLSGPLRRLWRWSGQLPTDYPLHFHSDKGELLPMRLERYPLYFADDVRREALRMGDEHLVRRWITLQAADPSTFPRPLSDLLGSGGRIFEGFQLLHHDQPHPFT